MRVSPSQPISKLGCLFSCLCPLRCVALRVFHSPLEILSGCFSLEFIHFTSTFQPSLYIGHLLKMGYAFPQLYLLCLPLRPKRATFCYGSRCRCEPKGPHFVTVHVAVANQKGHVLLRIKVTVANQKGHILLRIRVVLALLRHFKLKFTPSSRAIQITTLSSAIWLVSAPHPGLIPQEY